MERKVLAIQLLILVTKYRRITLSPFQFIQCSLYAALNGYTINNESVGTAVRWVLGFNMEHTQRHGGHLCLCREIFYHGPATQGNSKASAVYQGSHRSIMEAEENLLVTAMLISPDLGVSSPSWGSCDIPEVRRGSRLRELSLAKSPSADRLLAGWLLVSLSMSKATLSVHGTFGWKTKRSQH